MTTALQGGEWEREREWKGKAKIDRFEITITKSPVNYLLRMEKKKWSHIQAFALQSDTIVGKQEWEQASVGSAWQEPDAN